MSDKQFTFFELHFHDGVQLGPRTLGDGEPSAPDADGSAAEPEPAIEEAASTGPNVLGPLLGLGVLAAGAYAVRKLLGRTPEGLDALDDVEEEFEDGSADPGESVPIEITTPDEEADGGGIAPVVAGAVGLLVLLALAARKLLGGGEAADVEA